MYKFSILTILTVIFLFSCEQELNETIEPGLVFEIQTESSVKNTRDCYNEMSTRIGENFTGTSCSICSSYSANPGESITAYGVAYFNDANITTFHNLGYDITWSVIEGNASFTTGDDPRVIQIQMPDSFDSVVIKLENLAINGLVVSEYLTIRNATKAIAIDDPGQAGRVIYDKGAYSENWRYMETNVFYIGSDNAENRYDLAWGVPDRITGATKTEIGEGKVNTSQIVNFILDNSDAQEIPYAEFKSLSAWVANEFPQNGFSDWHLPSLEEAKVLMLNHGTLSEDPYGSFPLQIWTSTEVDADNAFAVDLNTGEVSVEAKNKKLKTIGVRYF